MPLTEPHVSRRGRPSDRLVMDATAQRLQRETLEALRRLEDILGDVNRETVRVEGLVREQGGAFVQALELLRDEVKALRENVPWPGERGSR